MTIQEMVKRKTELGFSNAMLAEKSGVPRSTVQKVLGGFTRAPRKATLRALEDALLKEQALTETENMRRSAGDGAPTLAGARKDMEDLRENTRAELIDGQIYRLPAPSRIHQEIIVRVLVLLANHLAAAQAPGRIYPAPFGVWPGGEEGGRDYFEPDLMVVGSPERLTDTGCAGAPDFVLEVTSPATKFRDYTVKPFKYRAAGVKECWIADPDAGVVITYWFGGGEAETHVFTFGEDVPFRLYPGLTAKLGE